MDKDRFAELLAKEFSGEIRSHEIQELKKFLGNESFSDLYTLLHEKRSTALEDDQVTQVRLLAALRGRMDKEESENERKAVPVARKFASWRFLRVAALIILCLSIAVGGAILLFERNSKDQILISVVAPGEQKKAFLLPDGSRIILNAGSEVCYPATFSRTGREISLEGEAFFDIKKDRTRPFIIHTRDMDVRVLGTAFNVRAYADESESQTTLIRGKVEVELHNNNKQKVVLAPSEKLVVRKASGRSTHGKGAGKVAYQDLKAELTTMRLMDTTIVETSWLQDKMVFKDAPLRTVCADIERRYAVKIVIQNKDLSRLHFTASFKDETIREIISALSSAENFQYKIKDGLIIIY